MQKLSIITALIALALVGSVNAEEKMSMSDADKKMYAELLDNNPADMEVSEGEQLFGELVGTANYAKVLGVKEKDLPKTIAGFPRYIESAKKVVTLSQSIQMAAMANEKPIPKLEIKEMVKMTAYVKSLANGQKTSIDVKANKHMAEMFKLGQEIYEERRGGRGLACNSCHSSDIVGQRLRMQPLPDLGAKETAAAGTWPAYRMTQGKMVAFDKRMQECMKNALLAEIPMGSDEMVALEVFVTNKTKGNAINVPGVKR